MGHILPLAPLAWPSETLRLAPGELALLRGLRLWVAGWRRGEDPLPELIAAFDALDASPAGPGLDALMRVLARAGGRRLAIHCPHCPQLAADETLLVHAIACGQRGDTPGMLAPLAGCGLNPVAARFAGGPAEAVGRVLGANGWRLPRRAAPTA
jgi:hypothetical protein